jgi:hypothetical protein
VSVSPKCFEQEPPAGPTTPTKRDPKGGIEA